MLNDREKAIITVALNAARDQNLNAYELSRMTQDLREKLVLFSSRPGLSKTEFTDEVVKFINNISSHVNKMSQDSDDVNQKVASFLGDFDS